MKYLVARSYMQLEQISDEYTVKNKTYVKVRTKTGIEKQVRTYTKEEWTKLYGETPSFVIDHSSDKFYRSQKDVLGFKNGYVWIFRGDTYNEKEYLKSIGCVYRKSWGWSLSSELTLPEDFPQNLTPVKLTWEAVGKEDKTLKPDEQVLAAVNTIMYEKSPSKFYGEVGENIIIDITIEKIVHLEGAYGPSRLFIMKDANQNVFCWTTACDRDWEVGENYKIKAKIKAHKTYHNCDQTVLSRCSEVKK